MPTVLLMDGEGSLCKLWQPLGGIQVSRLIIQRACETEAVQSTCMRLFKQSYSKIRKQKPKIRELRFFPFEGKRSFATGKP